MAESGQKTENLLKAEAEIWDLYSRERQLLGRDHIRGVELPQDAYHLAISVWICNKKGEYLISQRAASRQAAPLKWECTGGAVIKGEDTLVGAIREVKEEVGVDLQPEDGRLLFTEIFDTVNGKRINEIKDVWLFSYDGEVDLRHATTDEVAQVKWMSRDQIRELYESGEMVGGVEYFFTRVDYLR